MKEALEIIKPYCFSETDTLKQVILGYPDNLYKNREFDPKIDGNNQTTIKNRAIGNIPSLEKSVLDFVELKRILEKNGVEVLKPDPCSPETKSINQMFIRDIGFVIGERFFVSSMARLSRRREWESIEKFINKMPKEFVIRVPDNIVLEGGDIVVDKGNVFVGISQRTSREGLEFLQEQLDGSEFSIIPLELLSIREGEDVLHLDCAFVPVGSDSALIYSEGMSSIPKEILDNYNLINVTKEEQGDLAVNVLTVSPTKVVSRDISTRINEEMRDRGIDVIEISFNQAPKSGGSLRCCSLPIIRSPKTLKL